MRSLNRKENSNDNLKEEIAMHTTTSACLVVYCSIMSISASEEAHNYWRLVGRTHAYQSGSQQRSDLETMRMNNFLRHLQEERDREQKTQHVQNQQDNEFSEQSQSELNDAAEKKK